MLGKEKQIPIEADLNLITFHIQKKDINNFEKSLKNILSKYEQIKENEKEILVQKLSSEIKKLPDEKKLKFFKILLKILQEYDIIDREYFHIGLDFCKLLQDNKNYDECIEQINILIKDTNNYSDKKKLEDIISELNEMKKNISLYQIEQKEEKNNKGNNPKGNKKKNKKKKFKDFDFNMEEYDENKEKEERNEMLKLLEHTFSLNDEEMNTFINFVEEQDFEDIDNLISILLDLFCISEPEHEEDVKEKDIPNITDNKEEKKEPVVQNKTKLSELLEEKKEPVIKNETKFGELLEEKKEPIIKNKTKLAELLESVKNKIIKNEISDKDKPKKPKSKINLCSCLDLKRIKNFLKENGNNKKVDLHGYTLIQSMCIIEKKLKALREKISYDNLKEITLEIITGIGNHSPGHKAILKPKITSWLKLINRDNKFRVESPIDKGWILVTIYK